MSLLFSFGRKLSSVCLQRGNHGSLQQATQSFRFVSAVPVSDEVDDSARPPPPSGDVSKDGKVLHPELLNNQILTTQYAVRGELYLRAEQLRRAGKPIIFTNGKRRARHRPCNGNA